MFGKLHSVVAVLMLSAGAPAFGGLVTSHTDTGLSGATADGVLSADEYGPGNSYSYSGGGGGFGGTLGGGTLYLQSDPSNLYVGFQPGGNLNDLVTIHFDTRAGGFSDVDMDDQGDGGRRASSNLTRDVDDPFPVLADFSLVLGNFGIVLFELNAGNTPNHLEFKQFNNDSWNTGSNTSFREIAIPLSNLDNPGRRINFFASYVSDSGFSSNESMPGETFNGGGNPGFDNGGQALVRANWHEFVRVPEPSTLALLGLAALACLGRIRRKL